MVVSGHREFDYAELLTATFALRAGASLFATSRDPTLPMPGGAWPGTGATLAAVETASGKTAEIGGKPERHLFDSGAGADRRRWASGDGRRPDRLRHRGRASGPAWRRSSSSAALPRGRRRRLPIRLRTLILDDLAALLR